ncbi:MAG: dihydropteroate synthase [Bacteroidota bacterium]|nr:dihydropteroate synthase [Bacteroidota bacterium]
MFTLNCRGKLLVAHRPLIMGILNSTPDSFYAGSRVASLETLLQTADRMIADGADILDIGGQSSRPGAEEVGVEEELQRVIAPISAIHKRFPHIPLSVDTWHARVAEQALSVGASIVNDVSGGTLDPMMIETVGRLGAPYVCMHMRGDPATMARHADYEDVTREVLDLFIRRIDDCRRAGIHDLILDPGLGFAKRAAHNLALLKNLALLAGITGRPLLLGVSRKSFIYKALELPGPESALNGSTVMNTLALLHGTAILRVHDPKEAREAVRLTELYKSENSRS